MSLTIEEIENIRRNGVHAISYSERADKVIELCDLALQSLSLESVRSEALIGNVYAWLGYWRDKMPAEAVGGLQDILGPLYPKESAREDVHSTELRK